MGFQSEIIVTYAEHTFVDLETLVDNLLVNGWRLGVGNEIHTKDNESNYITLPYSLDGISSFQKILSLQVEHKKKIGFDISNLSYDLIVSLSYNFEQANTLVFSLRNEDPKNRLLNPIEEIRKYLEQIFNAVSSCWEVDRIKFVSGYDYEEVYVMKGEELTSYSNSIINSPS